MEKQCIVIKGKEYPFSATSPKDLLRWDAARKEVTAKYAAIGQLAAGKKPDIPELKDMSELQMHAYFLEQCVRAMTDLIDGVLGDGTCNGIFGPEIDDFLYVVDVYDEFIDGLDKQGEALAERNKKYLPDEEQ